MSKPMKLSYFDFDGGRGESARIMLSIGGIEFEDDRIPGATWPARKGQTPFGGLPVLEIDGTRITQSNAINRYIGRRVGLYPTDAWQAALCDEICDAAEDYNGALGQSRGIADRDALRAARERFIAGPLTLYLRRFEELLKEHGGEWFADHRFTVADLKVADIVRHIQSGMLDFIPTDTVEKIAPTLAAHRARVLAVPGVAAYYARRPKK